MNTATKLNSVQNHLLTLFSKGMGEGELNDIRDLLVQYYQEKIERELDAFWDRKQFTQDSFKDATSALHLRSSQKGEE
ncbi:MAG: hypothetical protein AAF806_20180 [Bacteroidota bacterium]